MDARLTSTILLLMSSILMANGLQCYHCRLNLCDHEYCESAMGLFKESSSEVSEYIGVYNWSTIPSCPADWQSASASGSRATEFNQTCHNLGDSCGQLVYNITTKSVLNLVSNSNDSQAVPVIGSGTSVYKSAVVVLGCIPTQHKCKNGYKQNDIQGSSSSSDPTTTTTTVPTTTALSSSNSSRATQSKLSNLENINTVSNCCYCDKNLCNGNDLVSKNGTAATTQTLQCTSALSQPAFDGPITSGATISSTHLVIAALTPLIALLFID